MLFIPTTRLRGRRMCIVFVTCLTEGAREALSTPKHPKLTKVKITRSWPLMIDRFSMTDIWKARFFIPPPLKSGALTSGSFHVLVGEGFKGESLFRGREKKDTFRGRAPRREQARELRAQSRASLPLVFSPGNAVVYCPRRLTD